MNELLYQRHQKAKEKSLRKIKSIFLVAIILVVCILCYLAGKVFAKLKDKDAELANTKVSQQSYSEKSSSDQLASGEQKAVASSNEKQSSSSNDINATNKSSTYKDKPWNLILVNPWNKIPDNMDIKLTELKNGQAVDERVYPDLQKMMDDCRAAGLSPLICSSYRTTEKQTRLYNNQIDNYIKKGFTKENAVIEAGKWSAVPGTSEHQLGLAVDIVATSNQMLDKSQEKTAEQKWLMENSYKYGFILRYPPSKSKLTGINYEPWHYRYVGKQAAEEIKKQGVCLEEYLKSK